MADEGRGCAHGDGQAIAQKRAVGIERAFGHLAQAGARGARLQRLTELDAIDVGGHRGDRLAQRLPRPPRRSGAAAQHHLGQVVAARVVHQRLGNTLRRQHGRTGTQRLGELDGLQNALAAFIAQPLQGRRLNVHRMPAHTQLLRQLRRAAHHMLGALVRADAAQQRAFGLPDLRDRAVAAVGLHVVFDPVGRAAQRQFAQRHQVALAKEVLRGAFGLGRQVHLAGGQPFDQLVGRCVDQHHLVGLVEEGVGQGLLHFDAGDAADHVVQALQVLHVERAVDVDAGSQQLFDVLPALGVARARHVGMGQLVDQDQARLACQCGIEVEFRQPFAAVIDQRRRQHRQAFQQCGGLAAAVRLDDARQHVHALRHQLARGQQHGAGLADAGRRAEVDAQAAARRALLVLADLRQQGVGVRAGVVVHRGAAFSRPACPGGRHSRARRAAFVSGGPRPAPG